MFSIRKNLNYVFGKYAPVNKVAFFINEEYIFDHYYNVMLEMKNDEFDIILDNKFKSITYNKVVNDLKNNGWSVKFLDEVMFVNWYKCLITHLYLWGETTEQGTLFSRFSIFILELLNKIFRKLNINKSFIVKKQYFQNILGQYNIRFMYGADAGKNSFAEYGNNYNELFDMFFCHGPRDAKITKKLFDKHIFQMGYPRYDNYFRKEKDAHYKELLKEKYSCDNNKKIILWICTVNTYFSTIETYAYIMKKLAANYNIIVRPHPLEIDPQYTRFNQKVLDIVSSGIFILNDNAYQDMTELYLISDFVICDYGGSIFSALYMEKRIILFNHQDVYKDLVTSTSTSMEAREYLPSINENEVDKLKNYLLDDEYWIEADKNRDRGRKYYFGDLRADSAVGVANYLSNIINNKGFI